MKIQTKEISIDQFRYIKIHTWLRGLEGIKQKKCIVNRRASRCFFLSFFPQASRPSMNFEIFEIGLFSLCFLFSSP